MPLPEHIDTLSQWAVENATGRSPLDQRAFPVYSIPQEIIDQHQLHLHLEQATRISRADLLNAYSADNFTAEAKSFFVDIMRWGFGTREGYAIHRITQMLESDYRYTDIAGPILAGDYATAASMFKRDHPKMCGVAFCSKYAYFTSLIFQNAPIFPIFDSKVGAKVSSILSLGKKPIDFEYYQFYLELLHEVAIATEIREDAIELALFL